MSKVITIEIDNKDATVHIIDDKKKEKLLATGLLNKADLKDVVCSYIDDYLKEEDVRD